MPFVQLRHRCLELRDSNRGSRDYNHCDSNRWYEKPPFKTPSLLVALAASHEPPLLESPVPCHPEWQKISATRTLYSGQLDGGGGDYEWRFPGLDSSVPVCPFCSGWDFPDFFEIFPICPLPLSFSAYCSPRKEHSHKARGTTSTFPEKKVWETPQMGTPLV